MEIKRIERKRKLKSNTSEADGENASEIKYKRDR
jgi:hypothetical protein